MFTYIMICWTDVKPDPMSNSWILDFNSMKLILNFFKIGTTVNSTEADDRWKFNDGAQNAKQKETLKEVK